MILLIGAGAVGTILAAHLAIARREPVKLYVRDKDLAALQTAQEIRVDHVLGGRPPLVAPKPALTTSVELDGVDYLFICVKFPDLQDVLDRLPVIPPGCTLVSTLNGVGALRVIRDRFPQARLAPMTIQFNAQLLSPLRARITTRPVVRAGTDDARLLHCFDGSGMVVKRAAGESAAWGKLLVNLANAICALTHTTFKDLYLHPDLRACYAGVLDEAVAVLDRAGVAHPLPMPLPYPLYRALLRHGGPLPWWFARARSGLQEGSYPSMVADIEHGRMTEIGQLNGEIVCLGQLHGVPTPVNARLISLVQQIEGRPAVKYLTPGELRQRLGIASG